MENLSKGGIEGIKTFSLLLVPLGIFKIKANKAFPSYLIKFLFNLCLKCKAIKSISEANK